MLTQWETGRPDQLNNSYLGGLHVEVLDSWGVTRDFLWCGLFREGTDKICVYLFKRELWCVFNSLKLTTHACSSYKHDENFNFSE